MKKYWWLVLIVLTFPVLLNFGLSISTPFLVLSDSEHWLTFWSSYIGIPITLLILFQNERSNKETKAQQINIIKAQFRQKWLDDLKPILNKGINYIKITELGDILNCIAIDTERVEIYIRNEISLCISEPTELTLHLSASTKDKSEKIELDYIKLYSQIFEEYSILLTYCDKNLLLLSNSTTFEKINNCLEYTIINEVTIFTQNEIKLLRSTQTVEDFIKELHKSIIDRYIEFANFYRPKRLELIDLTHKLIAYETKVLMKDFK